MRAFKFLMLIVIILCVVASATFAFEFGWTRGASDVHRWTFALAAVALDLLKAGLPIFGALAWAESRPGRSLICWFVFAWLTGLSLWCAYGTTAVQLAEKIAVRAAMTTTETDRRAIVDRLRAQREALPAFTPTTAGVVAAAAAAIATAEAQARAECGNGDPRQRGPHCRAREGDVRAARDRHAEASADAAVTGQAADLDQRIAVAEAALARVDGALVAKEADPQSASMAKAIGADKDLIAAISHAIFAVAIELGSGVGLWLVFGHGVPAGRREEEVEDLPAATVLPVSVDTVLPESDAQRVARFFLDAVRPALGRRIRATDLRTAYLRWCELRGMDPMSQTMFGRVAEWPKSRVGGAIWYQNCELVPAYTRLAAPGVPALIEHTPSRRLGVMARAS